MWIIHKVHNELVDLPYSMVLIFIDLRDLKMFYWKLAVIGAGDRPADYQFLHSIMGRRDEE